MLQPIQVHQFEHDGWIFTLTKQKIFRLGPTSSSSTAAPPNTSAANKKPRSDSAPAAAAAVASQPAPEPPPAVAAAGVDQPAPPAGAPPKNGSHLEECWVCGKENIKKRNGMAICNECWSQMPEEERDVWQSRWKFQ